jgi:hypothetical protein
MSAQVIATRTDGVASYVENVLLEKLYYRLQFDWNDRAFRWYMTLYDSTNVLIVGSLPVLIRVPLLRGTTTDQRRPPGDFIALDTSGYDIEAGFNDLGSRVLLGYVPSTDYIQL